MKVNLKMSLNKPRLEFENDVLEVLLPYTGLAITDAVRDQIVEDLGERVYSEDEDGNGDI